MKFNWYMYRTLTKNKGMELEFSHFGNWLSFRLSSELTFKRDHAGFEFCLVVFGFYLTFNIHDKRHWDKISNNWIG